MLLNILYSYTNYKFSRSVLFFNECTDFSNVFELDYFYLSHSHLVKSIFAEDLEACHPKSFVLELNWVIGIVIQSNRAHKICLPLAFFSSLIFQVYKEGEINWNFLRENKFYLFQFQNNINRQKIVLSNPAVRFIDSKIPQTA